MVITVTREIQVLDLSLSKLLILAVLALVVFGPHELPRLAGQAGRALRELRRIAEGAKADLREGLGPEFADFDLDDLNPRRFVHKHLLTEPGEPPSAAAAESPAAPAIVSQSEPCFDTEAT
jgi:sec-independent protein translocase protein TatB